MKSERRHELQHNALAEWITETYESLRPYGNTIVGVLALLVLILAGWLWWTRQAALDQATAWGDLFLAETAASTTGDASELSQLATRYYGSSAGAWAAVVAGNVSLANGSDKLLKDKSAAVEDLNKAAQSYRQALSQSQVPELRQQATYGLAQALETLCATQQADMAEAIKTYTELAEQWRDSAFGKAAQRRLDDLNQPATKAFYDQLAKYVPKPAAPEETDASGKQLHFDPKALPEPGTITLPALGGSADAATEKPATEQAEEKPAESTPATPPAQP